MRPLNRDQGSRHTEKKDRDITKLRARPAKGIRIGEIRQHGGEEELREKNNGMDERSNKSHEERRRMMGGKVTGKRPRMGRLRMYDKATGFTVSSPLHLSQLEDETPKDKTTYTYLLCC